MDTQKNQSGLNNEKNTGRRSFLRKMGAFMTTGVVVSTVPAVAKSDKISDSEIGVREKELSERIAILEAEKSIISLYRTYESMLNDGLYDEIPDMFVTDGEVVYNGGIFRGRDAGIARLYCKQFRNGLTGKKIDVTLDGKEEHSVNISENFLLAKASFPFAIQAGSPMVSDSVLVSMARLHGGGINKWYENGICGLTLTRKSIQDLWMIKRLEYHTESKSASVPAFTKIFPADPTGPDTLNTII